MKYSKFCQAKKKLSSEVHDMNSAKLLTRLRLDFSHLNERKFPHNWNDIINPMCSFSKEPEITLHCLLFCKITNQSNFDWDIKALNFDTTVHYMRTFQ